MSLIDITKPVSGNPTTQSVRDNFAAAAAEIDALDSAVTTLQGSVSGFDSHLTNTNNPHAVTKTQIGLGNVDNTSDVNKPISTATQTALNSKADSSALSAHVVDTGNPHNVSAAQIGLSNVNNTSDADKPVSTAQAAADTAVATAASNALAAHVAAADPHTGYALESSLAAVATSGAYADLTGKPTLGTAAPLNVAASGDAASGEVVKGSDSRLSDARTPTAHTHPVAQVSDSTATGRALVTATDAAAARGTLGLDTAATVGALPIPDPGSFYPTDTITAALQLIGGRHIYGTGSPEGVITAPVGTYYTDTVGTTGAWRWLKKIGTGNTGWSCIVGDTGSRNIASLITGATWSGGSSCRLQRIDSTVFLTLDVVTQTGFTAQSVLILPPGFTDAPTYLTPGYGGVQWYALSGNSVILNTSGANPGLRGMWSWPTNDVWPTTLPGTAG